MAALSQQLTPGQVNVDDRRKDLIQLHIPSYTRKLMKTVAFPKQPLLLRRD